VLQAQAKAEAPVAALIDWMQASLDRPLDVPMLAGRAGLSERSFYRKFTQEAHFVESLRLEAARTLLAKSLPLKTLAGNVGLSSSARFGQAFERRFGVAPSLFREVHRGAAPCREARFRSLSQGRRTKPFDLAVCGRPPLRSCGARFQISRATLRCR
jgi:transcriptional regulator GlxA family with amidase domain